MKYTTAKTVLKIYRKEGRFGKKKQRLKKGYAKNSSQGLASIQTDKHPSLGGSSTTGNGSGHPDLAKEDPFMQSQPTRCVESTLCGTFWASQIAQHFS